MKLKRILCAAFAFAAIFCMCAAAACSSGIEGKTYTFYCIEVDTAQYEEYGATPPAEEEITALEANYSPCYFTFNKDGTVDANIPYSVLYFRGNSSPYFYKSCYYYEASEDGVDYVMICSAPEAKNYYFRLAITDGMLCYENIYDRVEYKAEITADGKTYYEMRYAEITCGMYFKA